LGRAWHTDGRGEVYTHNCSRNDRYRFGHLRLEGRIILKCFLKKLGVTLWIGFIWLRIEFNGVLL
jgi:hypothetical protein